MLNKLHARKNRRIAPVTAALLAVLMLTSTGCEHNGYYSNEAPGGYYYADPGVCTEKALCPLLIAAAIGGLVAVLSHH